MSSLPSQILPMSGVVDWPESPVDEEVEVEFVDVVPPSPVGLETAVVTFEVLPSPPSLDVELRSLKHTRSGVLPVHDSLDVELTQTLCTPDSSSHSSSSSHARLHTPHKHEYSPHSESSSQLCSQ